MNNQVNPVTQFQKETGLKFYHYFASIDESATIDGDIFTHKAKLIGGRPVTFQYMPSHLKRMRTLDLFPIKICKFCRIFH